ncbi:hypothetical protein [Enteractinococcus helveticum]|nr:hypothetical protein [Enteractinococcus helveticum]
MQNIEDYLVGEMLDQQNGVNFADFFMSAFLGCRLADDAEVRTKQFTDSSLRWINNVDNHELKTQYATALLAYMHSQETTFQATDFATSFLRSEDQDSYLTSLPDEVSTGVIEKTLGLLHG